MISDRLLDLIRILTLSTEEKVERLPDLYPETRDAHAASGTNLSFGQWLYEQIVQTDYGDREAVQKALIPVQELPSWRLLQYVGVIDDNRWLLHLTDEASFYHIQHAGFYNGILDPWRLAFTLESDADRGRVGYQFAFDATGEDWKKRLSTPDSLLGQHIVMFKAPGVVVDYTGSKPERFVIFEGPAARSFAFIDPVQEPGMYVVPTIADYEEDYAFGSKDIEVVVAWIMENRDAYESVLIKPEQEETR